MIRRRLHFNFVCWNSRKTSYQSCIVKCFDVWSLPRCCLVNYGWNFLFHIVPASISGCRDLSLKTHYYTTRYIILLWCTLCAIYCLAYRKCQTEDFRCEVNGPGSGPCLPKTKRCDGYFDCRNHKDEENCGPSMNMSCPLDKFRCLNGQKCIDPKLKCDHQNNCGDNSDEENCSEYYIYI